MKKITNNYSQQINLVYEKAKELAEKKALAVMKDSIQDLIEESSRPVDDGGRMPVDTGFLRFSGKASLNVPPTGPIRGRHRLGKENGTIYPSDISGSVKNNLIKMKFGDAFYYGWSAIYASIQEFRYGFLVSACAKWKAFVNYNIRRLK